MSQKNYSVSIALTKLQSAVITTKKGTKCILIPINANYLTENNGAIYMNCNVVVRDEVDQYGQNGFIAQKLDSETYKSLGKEKANEIKLPILGNIKVFGISGNDTAGTTHIAEPINIEEDDSLPF